jgi:hypothetical protein
VLDEGKLPRAGFTPSAVPSPSTNARRSLVGDAWLGSGEGDPGSAVLRGKSARGDTDFWGVGARASSDPDRIGFVTELAIGYRRARSKFDNGDEIQFTDAPFEPGSAQRASLMNQVSHRGRAVQALRAILVDLVNARLDEAERVAG